MLQVIQIVGAAVFAASGAIAAGRKRMDLMGVVVIAIVTAIGGGTVRDLLLDRHPLFWIADPSYLLAILGATAITLSYVRLRRPPDQSLAVADTLGLALFTILGARVAEDHGTGGIVAVLMGTITGVAGGILRDVLSAEVPFILKKGELYASAAIGGATLYLVLEVSGVPRPIAAAAGMAAIAALRFASIFFGIKLPVLPIRDG